MVFLLKIIQQMKYLQYNDKLFTQWSSVVGEIVNIAAGKLVGLSSGSWFPFDCLFQT